MQRMAQWRLAVTIIIPRALSESCSIANKTYPNPPEGVGNVTMYVMGAEEPG